MARLKNEYNFIAGVHYDNELHFNHYSLKIDFYTNSEMLADHNIGMDRIQYFLQEIVYRSVFMHEDDVKTIKKYVAAKIPVLSIPQPGPFDPMVLAIIATKLNAILEDTLVITDAELESTLGGHITYVWDSADDDDDIHNVVSDDDETKWWASADPRFVSYPADTDIEAQEEKKPLKITWEKLALTWYDEDAETPESAETTIGKGKKKSDNSTIIRISDFNKDK